MSTVQHTPGRLRRRAAGPGPGAAGLVRGGDRVVPARRRVRHRELRRVHRDQEVPRLDRRAVRPPPAPTLAPPPPSDGVCVFIENMGRNYNVVRNLTV